MKKKSILALSLGFCFILGIVLITVGVLTGGRIIRRNPYLHSQKSVSHELKNISLTDNNDIQNIDLDISTANLQIKSGDKFSISGGILKKNEVKDGTWTIKTAHYKFFTDFSFLSLPFFSFNDDSEDKTNQIIITIPKNVTLNSVKFDLSAGNINIDSMTCDNMFMDVSAGSSHINEIKANSIDFSVSTGDLSIETYQIAQNAKIDCSTGSLRLGSKTLYSDNYCNNSSIDCSLGSVRINGKLTGQNKTDCSMGDITLNLIGGKNNYNIKSSSSMGSVKSSGTSTSKDTAKYGDLSLDCNMGSINVYYH